MMLIYLCGVDVYGSTTMLRAQQENLTCEELCDKYTKFTKRFMTWFNIDFDIWGKTYNEKQTSNSHEIFLELYKNGYIEEKTLCKCIAIIVIYFWRIDILKELVIIRNVLVKTISHKW